MELVNILKSAVLCFYLWILACATSSICPKALWVYITWTATSHMPPDKPFLKLKNNSQKFAIGSSNKRVRQVSPDPATLDSSHSWYVEWVFQYRWICSFVLIVITSYHFCLLVFCIGLWRWRCFPGNTCCPVSSGYGSKKENVQCIGCSGGCRRKNKIRCNSSAGTVKRQGNLKCIHRYADSKLNKDNAGQTGNVLSWILSWSAQNCSSKCLCFVLGYDSNLELGLHS